MKRLPLFLALLACAPLPPPCDREAVVRSLTTKPEEVQRLLDIPVEYVAGMPACNGHMPDEVVTGCWYGDRIEVATIDWSRTPPFRYDSDICASLAHEYRHALGWQHK